MYKIISLILFILFNTQIYAVQPKNDWYAGIFLGPSASASSSIAFGNKIEFTGTNVIISGGGVSGPNASIYASSGLISYSVLGEIGGQLGYRFCNRHRIELEFFYNNNPIKELQLYDYKVVSQYYNEDVYVKSLKNKNNSVDAFLNGEANSGAFMFNFIYDFLSASADSDGFNKVAPFVGVGIGYSYVQNAMQIYRPTTSDPALDPYPNREIFAALQKRYVYAGQVLAGINYFIDDFTWIGIDMRYFTTGSSASKTAYTYIDPTNWANSTTILSPVNIFPKKTQILSANLSFSGTLNF